MLVMVGLAGCVMSTTRFYVPSPDAGRVTLDGFRDRVSSVLHIQCPQLLHGRVLASGAAQLALLADSAGLVQRATIQHGSGSAELDDILGALAAQLTLAPALTPGAEHPPRLVVNYACSTDAFTVDARIAE